MQAEAEKQDLDTASIKTGWGIRADIEFEGKVIEKNILTLVTKVEIEESDRKFSLVDLGGHPLGEVLESKLQTGSQDLLRFSELVPPQLLPEGAQQLLFNIRTIKNKG